MVTSILRLSCPELLQEVVLLVDAARAARNPLEALLSSCVPHWVRHLHLISIPNHNVQLQNANLGFLIVEQSGIKLAKKTY